jgi:ethanolamine ammonia-lyase small subunit
VNDKVTRAGVVASPWQGLRRLTAARVALGRAGTSLPTPAHLEFQLAHAQARDAVHLPFDAAAVTHAVQALGFDVLALGSAAGDRATYLQRPDLGRRLDDASRSQLAAWRHERGSGAARFDVAFVVADGLSALAVHRHAAALLAALQPWLAREAWRVAPVAVVRQGRVAVADEIGELLDADLVVILLGERPGLSSPDSLGVYFTWAPRVGCTDAQRNCISNVRPEGLPIDRAADKLLYLMTQARQRRASGVELKDDADDAALAQPQGSNFLLDAP